MIENYYEDIVENEVKELSNTFIGIFDVKGNDAEWFLYDSMKTMAEKFLKLGYVKGIDDCKAAAEHLRSQEA